MRHQQDTPSNGVRTGATIVAALHDALDAAHGAYAAALTDRERDYWREQIRSIEGALLREQRATALLQAAGNGRPSAALIAVAADGLRQLDEWRDEAEEGDDDDLPF